ncbi:hypothetical protein GOL96_05270 [Sinorhizobium medicae]|nr:hypothetical protein [Sinorhizobium medicae]MDX0409793.1 hypothetical protein [Sinorhizobium medicae]MDX0416287.1 hypothetical protein [Sinorhizobium medicae]MDX0433614.1 hypothetical protein [Sinorhizobium medicae]MDX0447243.1 hypothetical protein [Sinorhizobium medicae]
MRQIIHRNLPGGICSVPLRADYFPNPPRRTKQEQYSRCLKRILLHVSCNRIRLKDKNMQQIKVLQ